MRSATCARCAARSCGPGHGVSATRGYPVEDTVAIGLRFASGALGSFMLSDTGVGTKLGADVAGEQELRDLPRRGLLLIAGVDGSLAIPTSG